MVLHQPLFLPPAQLNNVAPQGTRQNLLLGRIPGKVRSTFQHAHKQLPPAKEDAERTVAGPWRPSIFQESAVWLLPLGPEGLHDRMEDELHCHLQVFAASLFLEEVELLDLELGHEGWDSLPLDCPINAIHQRLCRTQSSISLCTRIVRGVHTVVLGVHNL